MRREEKRSEKLILMLKQMREQNIKCKAKVKVKAKAMQKQMRENYSDLFFWLGVCFDNSI